MKAATPGDAASRMKASVTVVTLKAMILKGLHSFS
jgi:hypothetical protein